MPETPSPTTIYTGTIRLERKTSYATNERGMSTKAPLKASTHVTVQSPTVEGLRKKLTHLMQVLDDDDFTGD